MERKRTGRARSGNQERGETVAANREISAELVRLAAARLAPLCPGMRFRFEEADASRFRKSGSALLDILRSSGPTAVVLSGKARTIAIAVPGNLPVSGKPRFMVPIANFERFPTTTLNLLGIDLGMLVDVAERRLGWLVPFVGESEQLVIPVPDTNDSAPGLTPQQESDARIGSAVRTIAAELGLTVML